MDNGTPEERKPPADAPSPPAVRQRAPPPARGQLAAGALRSVINGRHVNARSEPLAYPACPSCGLCRTHCPDCRPIVTPTPIIEPMIER